MKQADLTRTMNAMLTKGEPFVLATVVKSEGSTLAKPGFKVIISNTGEVLHGSLGGGCPESVIIPAAKRTMRTGTAKTIKVYLEGVEDSVGAVLRSNNRQDEDEIHVETNCGGVLEIYLEPYLPTQRLVLIGQGGRDEVEDALVKMGKSLDFEVVVIDHSPVLSEEPDQLMKDANFRIEDFHFHDTDSAIVLTKGERDVSILRALSKSKLRYVGMLASSQRVNEDIAQLRQAGVSEGFISSLRAPIGADIGAVTATEISLSIMTEIIARKYDKPVPGKTLVHPKSSRIEK